MYPIAFAGKIGSDTSSPRWLLEHDRTEEAAVSLAKLRGASNIADIQVELDEIHANILWHKKNSITSAMVFIKEKPLWSHLWRAWALSFLQQMSGAAGIRYYLPTNFIAAGTSESLSLLASGIDGTVQVGCTIAAMFFIDKLGRRHSLGIGAIIMAFCLMVSCKLMNGIESLTNLVRSTVLCNSRTLIRPTATQTTATSFSYSSSLSDVRGTPTKF